jgi:hemolysin activation/secretion protein
MPSARGQVQAVVPADVANPGAATSSAVIPAPVAPATRSAAAPAAVAPATSSAAAPAPVAPATSGAAAPAPAAPAVASATATAAAPTVAATAGAPSPGQAVAGDGKAYAVTELKVGYKFPHPGLPAIEELMNSEIRLGVAADGYTAPHAGMPTAVVKLGEIGKSGPQKLYKSGIAAIYSHLLRLLNARGIIGVFVVVDPADIKMDSANSEKDEDVRGARTSLQLVVVTSVVKEVRTVAKSEVPTADRVDIPQQASIREHSPLQPAEPGATMRNDLLRKDVLDDYVLRLNRYPGRRVDVAMSPTDKTGELTLDYLVSEARPWYAFAQVANTGTSQTSDFRERFGFVDNQLTGHDDIFTLDYSTAGFSKSHALIATYELPFFNFDRARYKVYGSWNEYTASDVGRNLQHFSGSGWTAGNELTVNIFQRRELFIDAVGGFKAQESTSQSLDTGTNGLGLFWEPYLGLKLERITDLATTTAQVLLTGYFTGSNTQDLEGLGRPNLAGSPAVLHYELAQSFYLEPLLEPERFARGKSTLAHEIYVATRGQYAFNNRLFPQAEDVAGGLYSVRGYPESIAAGDSVVLGTAEYRFHVPRIFPAQDDPTKTPFLWDQSFRFAPQTAYSRPDWDLILRAFVDAGQVVISSRQSYENNATLVGAGLGIELQYKQNFNLRLDWGNALTDVKDEVKAGSQRVHITATILY